jgi:hypothetical protein
VARSSVKHFHVLDTTTIAVPLALVNREAHFYDALCVSLCRVLPRFDECNLPGHHIAAHADTDSLTDQFFR